MHTHNTIAGSHIHTQIIRINTHDMLAAGIKSVSGFTTASDRHVTLYGMDTNQIKHARLAYRIVAQFPNHRYYVRTILCGDV